MQEFHDSYDSCSPAAADEKMPAPSYCLFFQTVD